MWSGLLSAIPSGWHLCDGTNGTPDLRSRFIKGAAPGSNPGTVGGASTHAHELPIQLGTTLRTLPPLTFGVGSSRTAARAITTGASTMDAIVALSQTVSHEPPYFALAFIMKL